MHMQCKQVKQRGKKKIYELKKRAHSKALIILIAEYASMYKMLNKVSPNAYKYMNESKPTTVIFNDVQNISSHVVELTTKGVMTFEEQTKIYFIVNRRDITNFL